MKFQIGFLIFALYFFSLTKIRGQENKLQILSNKLAEYTHYQKDIDSIFDLQKKKYVSLTQNKVYKNPNLSIQPEDSIFIQNEIDKLIRFEKNFIQKKIVFREKQKGKKRLKRLYKELKTNPKILVNLRNKHLSVTRDYALKELEQFKKNYLPNYLKIIQNRKKPIPIKIYLNNKKQDSFPKDFNVFLLIKNQKKMQKISIFDTINQGIKKNPVENYRNIYGLSIIYNHQNFVFFPKETYSKLPRKFKMAKNILSKINFTEDDTWNIYIDEMEDHILMTLENSSSEKVENPKIVRK